MQRRVHFFRADLLHQRAGPTGEIESHRSDIAKVFAHIKSLPWTAAGEPSAYLPEDDGHTAIRVVEIHSDHVVGQFARSRRRGLPPQEKEGLISVLALDEGAGIYEASHFALFWDRPIPILVLEYNQHAPRQRRFGEYVEAKLKDHKTVLLDDARFYSIPRGDALEQLEAATGPLAEFQVAVPRNQISELTRGVRNDQIGDALAALSEFSPEGMELITLYLHRGWNKKKGGAGSSFVKEAVAWLRMNWTYLKQARVKFETTADGRGTLVDLNLLNDSWSDVIDLRVDADRMIDSTHALETLVKLYRRVGGSLQ